MLIAGLAAVSFLAPQAGGAARCNQFRPAVKTGWDADRYKVDQAVTYTSVAHLRSFAAPASFAGYADHRFRRAERRTWQVTARLVRFRIADDGDIHMTLAGKAGRTMIAEIPDPDCVPAQSLWKAAIASARAAFLARYPFTSTTWQSSGAWVRVRGLGFFDRIHKVSGQAPDGIELHPVTRVVFSQAAP